MTLEIVLGSRRLGSLGDIVPTTVTTVPLVSIIVPACNEAETIGPALATLLAQDYTRLEIVVVNDRSTDATGETLREMQRRHPGLIILDIHESCRRAGSASISCPALRGRAGHRRDPPLYRCRHSHAGHHRGPGRPPT